MRSALAVFALSLTCLSAACASAQPAQPAEQTASRFTESPAHGGKLLLMHYMPWYQTPELRGYWGGHWTGWDAGHDPAQIDAQGKPDIWSHYHPLIGTYDSADPAVLECHLLQMKLAGVDGVIVDWYGILDAADYAPNQVASVALFDACAKMGMGFAACYEDRTVEQAIKEGVLKQEQAGEHLAETFQWLQEHWFSADHYVRYFGKPLLLCFGPIYLHDERVWQDALASTTDRPAFFPLHHLWPKIGGDGGFTWVHYNAWEGAKSSAQVRKNLQGVFDRTSQDPERVITSAVPGFRDVYKNPHPVLSHRNGVTLRETLGAALAAESPVVQLVTWNDYGEGTMFEPTHEFGYLFLEILQDARRAEIGAEAMPFTHDDLRLPARLLELRKAGAVAQDKLDAIADHLRDGRVAEARAALDALAAASH
ncbi:MAG: glycoside hydrolase family 71/99-like protein [Planctomycetota bacterium]